MKINDITFLFGVFFLPIWLAWELLLLKWRGEGMAVGTISMVMKDRAYQFNVIPFFWASMMAHWWFNWLRTPVYSVPYPAVIFWLMVVGTLVLDVWLWRAGVGYSSLPDWAKVLRAPMVQCGLGIISAYFLFPQRAPILPGMRWW